MLPPLLVMPPSFGVGSGSVAYRLTPMVRCEMLVGFTRPARTLERSAADLENILAWDLTKEESPSRLCEGM